MAAISVIPVIKVDLTRTVLTTLQDATVDGAAKTALTTTLSTALETQLANATAVAGYTDLAPLIAAIPTADVVADKDLSLQAFVAQSITLPSDAATKQAVETAIQSLSTTTTVGTFLGLNTPINTNALLAGVVGQTNLAQLLQTSPALAATPNLIDDFISTYSSFQGSMADLWATLARNSEFDSAIGELQLTLQLGTLTLGSPSLVAAIRARFPKLVSLTSLVSMSAADWTQLITSQHVTVPDSIAGATPAAQAANYADAITGTLAAAFPGTVFVQSLQQSLATSKLPLDQGVATALGNANDFDLLNTNISTYIAQHGGSFFTGVAAAEQSAVTQRLAAWQRVARVASDFPTAQALISAGYTSAYRIASTPRASFLLTMGGPLGSSAAADAVFRRAQQIGSTAMSVFMMVRQSLTGIATRAIGDGSGAVATALSGPAGIPNWQELFGSLSSCACSDCQSVYSASAYFVDLLQFLANSAANSAGQTPLQALLARRPDLPYIKLNCVNTNTELPYVDLVNEIMESFVVLNGSLNSTTAHDTSKSASAADLSASPEYTLDAAYNSHLSVALYPPPLPFDRWLLTARTYLNFLGSSLYQVMQTCQTSAAPAVYSVPLATLPAISLPPFVSYDATAHTLSTSGAMTPDGEAQLLALSGNAAYTAAVGALFTASQQDTLVGRPSRIEIACEYLNISEEECLILTGANFAGSAPASPPQLCQYYGFAAGSSGWETTIAQVETFLDVTGIEYADLIALLEARSLNPALSVMVQINGSDPCDLSQAKLVDLSSPAMTLQDTTLDHLQRFIRLWRKIGWAICDLDKTMTALGAATIDQEFLSELAAVQQLLGTTSLPVASLLSFWATIDTDGRNSLYLSLFQNPAVVNPPDPSFTLIYTSSLLAALPVLQLPNPMFPNLGYATTPSPANITLNGVMTDAEYAQLTALASDPSYLAAINYLHTNGVAGATTQQPLASLPVVTLPAGLTYNSSTHQLSYTGPMTDDYRDQLNFTNDPAYQTAIDVLYDLRTLFGTQLAPPVSPTPAPTLTSTQNTLLAALNMSAQDLGALRGYANLPAATTPLSLANVSVLTRYALLAQALTLSVSDLLIVIELIGVDPFASESPVATLIFVQAAQAIQASPFTIDQLNYLYLNTDDPISPVGPQSAAVSLLLTTLQAGLAAIAAADAIVPDPKGALLAKTLATALGPTLANQAMGLITGSGIYSAALTPPPAITLPSFVSYNPATQLLSIVGAMSAAQETQLLALSADATYQAAVAALYQTSQAGGVGTYTQTLAALPAIAFPPPPPLVLYDPAAQMLRITGAMTTAEESALLLLSSNAAYTAAIQNLHQQPIDFINNNLAAFLNPSVAITTLIENPSGLSVADRVAFVAAGLMPYLCRMQSVSLVTQTLSDNLSLSPQLCSMLLNTVLHSQLSAPPATAMFDYLALVGDGLSAIYYPNATLSGTPAAQRIDATVDFSWGFSLSGAPVAAAPFSAKWTGYVMPQYSETYTFYVRAGDGMRLSMNGSSLINSWVDATVTERSGTIALTAGQLYAIELDYYDDSSSPGVVLSWSSPSTPKAVVPSTQLFSGTVLSSLTPIVNSYILLYKTSLLISTFPLTAALVTYLCQNGAQFAGVDPANPTLPAVPFDPNLLFNPASPTPAVFNQWQRLNAVVSLSNALPGRDTGLLNVFAAASASSTSTPGTLSPAVSSAILQATNWNATDLAFLASTAAYALSDADFTNEQGTGGIGLVQLQACAALLTRLGVSAAQLFNWANFAPDVATEEANAKDIQNTVKAKYDDATWDTVGKPLNDAVREGSKEALIAYILANAASWGMTAPEGSAITEADQLYEYFLIDVQMSPCMLTSRIVQASAAVQLFVQRCLLNIETTVSPAAIDPVHWQTLQNFRVWQAARMVLCYPELYMVPTLRDDQTPLFQTFSAALLQNPPTEDSVQQAYLDYLNGLNQIARLDIRASYWQIDPDSTPAPDGTADATNDILHVFGRTPAQPYIYYYRRLLNCGQFGQSSGASWTPWELVDSSIEGDHLVPVVWDGRLFLFWAVFAESADPASQPPMSLPPSGQTTYTTAQPQQDLSITLYWSEYQQGEWAAKQTCAPLTIPNYSGFVGTGALDTSLFSLTSSFAGEDSLSINVLYNWGGMGLTQFGQFTFSSCGSGPVPAQTVAQSFFDDWGKKVVPPENQNLLQPFNGYPFHQFLVPSYDFVESVAGQTMQLGLEVGYVPTGANPSGSSYGGPVVEILANKPSDFRLLFPQQYLESFGLLVPPSFPAAPSADDSGGMPGEPFFYEDNDRVYFVTERFAKASSAVADPSKESPSYGRGVLNPIADGGGGPIFNPGSLLSSPVSSPDPPPGIVQPKQPPEPSLSQILFSNHFHPFVCAFIREVNRYGLPELLTLTNQQITNDGGVVSGFTLSGSLTSVPTLTPGVLYAQGKLYTSINAPKLRAAAKGVTSFLYYNSSKGFYYNSGFLSPLGLTDSPDHSGDAVIGLVNTDSAGRITSVQSFNNGPYATLFYEKYKPTSIVNINYPLEQVDFSATGAYAIYNWELFFHLPVLVATLFDQNQMFDDAEIWWRYVLNIATNSTAPVPQRYWQFLPFYQCAPWDTVAAQIQNIFYPPSPGPPLGPQPGSCGSDISAQISAWQQDPFNPFAIARLRSVAFRMFVFLQYAQHRLSQGDNLFGQNTRESISEATMHYVAVDEMLGPLQQLIQQPGESQDYTYNDLVTLYGIDDFSNALVLIENDFPYLSTGSGSGSSGVGPALSMSSTVPYFCFPPNATLTSLWSTVQDRLYKIRNCMNIQGVVQQLPLFAPPISPALLVAAQAAGVSLSSVLSNTSAATPFYRCTEMLSRALDLCRDLREFGRALLDALEKQDADAVALLQATQETSLLQAMQQLKVYALQQANANVASLQDSLALATARQQWYQNLVNNGLTPYENQYVGNLQSANTAQQKSQQESQTAAQIAEFPNIELGVSGLGSPVATATFGSQQLVAMANAHAEAYQSTARQQSYLATRASILGQWDRRNSDWGFQASQAKGDMQRITDELAAAGFAVQMAQIDQANLNQRIQNAQAVQNFLQTKYTNTELYSWMVGQLSTVFFQAYQMTYDLATQTEVGFRFERGLTTSSYVQFGYWDSLKKGLMSGERLYADLKRLELAYMQTDVRQYEITKVISLVLFDPWALINLKATGQCYVSLPEAYFNQDYPGHYFRRIKTVSVTIPCVTGPYTSVNCTLTLLNSSLRVDSTASTLADYNSDAHFISNYAATQSIVTSTAQSDSGLFPASGNDPRYLPFEGAGAISTWLIELPLDCNPWNVTDSMTDFLLTVCYTSMPGSDAQRDFARQAAAMPPRPAQAYSGSTTAFASPQTPLQRMFSLRHEFPTEWYRFLNPPPGAASQSMSICLGNDRFPYPYRGAKLKFTQVELVVFCSSPSLIPAYTGGSPIVLQLGPPGAAAPSSVTLTSSAPVLAGAPYGSLSQPAAPAPASAGTQPSWTLQVNSAALATVASQFTTQVASSGTTFTYLSPAAIDDILMICHYLP